MSVLYLWIVLVHVASILLLLLMHGGVLAVTYAVREERRPERLAALLDLSALTFDSRRPFGRIFWLDLVIVVVSGVVLMVMGGFWRHVWPWASIVIFVAIMVAMTRYGSAPMTGLRRAAGLPYVIRKGMGKPEWMEAETANPQAIDAVVAGVRPGYLSAIGAGGFLILLWLMMFKPF
jgi:hypothetical protein